MRLWLQLAGVMATVAFVPLIVTGVFATKISVDKSRVASDTILQRDAEESATLVGTWVHAQMQTLIGWMRPYPLGELSQEHRDGLLRSVFVAVPTVRIVVLLDSRRQPVAEAVYLHPDQTPRLGRPAAEAADVERLVQRLPLDPVLDVRPGEAIVGQPYAPGSIDSPVVPIAVRSPHDPLSLGAEVSLGPIAQVISQQTTEKRAFALLDGEDQPVLGGAHPLIAADRIRLLPARDANFTYHLDDGRSVVGAAAGIPNTDWTLVVAEPVDQVYGAAAEITRSTAQVLAVSLLLAVAVGAVVGRSLSQPVQRLRNSAHAVAEGDYEHRVEIGRGDELGELAQAFNEMAATLARNRAELEAQREEIEAFNRELQRRVQERTAELERAQARLVESGQLAAIAQVGAGMAHELNNPLAAILGLTQLLQAAPEMEAHRGTLGRVESMARRCTDVVSAMLRFSSGEPVDPAQAPVIDTCEVIRDVIGLVQGPLRQGGVTVQLSLPSTPLRSRVDPVLLSRSLAPIMSSIAAGLPSGSSLRVGAERAESEGAPIVRLHLQVSGDPGEGSERDDWMASGMALWVARRLLDSAGGCVIEPQDGRTWRVELPGV